MNPTVRRFVLFLMAFVVASVPVVNAEVDTQRLESDEAPEGYYYDPATGGWYYYDGVTLTESSEPDGEDEGPVFDVYTKNNTHKIGYKIYTELKYIGSQEVFIEVDYGFTNADGDYCMPDATPSSTAPNCVFRDSIQTKDYLLQSSSLIVLGYIKYYHKAIDWKPNSGDAEAWGWLNDNSWDKNTSTYQDGPIAWSS